jgi:hypothetical protein
MVSQPISALLPFRSAARDAHRQIFNAQALGREHAPIPRDYYVVLTDQDRHRPSQFLDRCGDLRDL